MKSKLFTILVLVTFIASSAYLAQPALAWEKGHLKIVPSVRIEEKWDSNIFYDSQDANDDMITVITPAVFAEIGFGPFGKHKAKVDYKVDLGIFSKYDDQNYGNHDALAELKFDLNDYDLTVSDNFKFTSSRAGTEFEDRNLRKENTFKTLAEADFNKFSADLGYEHFIVDYHSNLLEALNRYENKVWTTGYVQVMPKTKALLELEYKNIQYKETSGRNANVYAIMAGVQGQPTEKLSGVMKVGYKEKTYINSNRDDFSNIVVHSALSFDATDRTNIVFTHERDGFESVYANNNYYTGDHFFLDAKHTFPGGVSAKLDSQFFYNDYPDQAPGDSDRRRDIEWAIGCGVDYVWKEYVMFDVGYRFHQRDSNIENRDYDQHVIMSSVKMQF